MVILQLLPQSTCTPSSGGNGEDLGLGVVIRSGNLWTSYVHVDQPSLEEQMVDSRSFWVSCAAVLCDLFEATAHSFHPELCVKSTGLTQPCLLRQMEGADVKLVYEELMLPERTLHQVSVLAYSSLCFIYVLVLVLVLQVL
jgi:hypothetical protein